MFPSRLFEDREPPPRPGNRAPCERLGMLPNLTGVWV